jgi:hypothetical protein
LFALEPAPIEEVRRGFRNDAGEFFSKLLAETPHPDGRGCLGKASQSARRL